MEEYIINARDLSKTYMIREASDAPLFKRLFTRKKYREVEALKGVSLKIKQGEFVGLIGNNGAGKSTLIKLMTGILYKTAGEIEVLGRDPFKHRLMNNAEIGVVFGQRTQLSWDLSALDSFNLYKHIYSIPDDIFKANIEKFTELFGMHDVLRQPVRTLSLGQRMQCEIAASFLHNPKIIFLDEPTIGLDVFNKEIITNILNTMKKTSDVTLILTTHDLEDMCKICDRAIVINNGEVLLEKDIDLLLFLNNQQKRLVFTTENESAPPITFEKDIKVSYEPHKIICERVEREEVQEVIATVTKQCFILDLSIEESNFTDIIKSYLKRQP